MKPEQYNLLQGRIEGGIFERFKLYGYLENFWKTTTTVMWENHKPFMSHRVQFVLFVWVWCDCCLF
jgi:hypothetical protein